MGLLTVAIIVCKRNHDYRKVSSIILLVPFALWCLNRDTEEGAGGVSPNLKKSQYADFLYQYFDFLSQNLDFLSQNLDFSFLTIDLLHVSFDSYRP